MNIPETQIKEITRNCHECGSDNIGFPHDVFFEQDDEYYRRTYFQCGDCKHESIYISVLDDDGNPTEVFKDPLGR